MIQFQRAERKRVSLKIAITGPSGSGKTFSALKLAQGMGKKVAMLDTENGSGSLYADMGEYDSVEIHAPYTIQKYLEVIRAAEAGGYEVLIIDSLSHAWAGEGGLLDQKSAKDARGGNQFTNWADISKQQEALKAALLQTPLHLIATMRSKQEYVQNEDERGKKSVQKVGMAPIQRDGMEYEFTTVFDVDMQHYAVASKDRTGLFDGVNQQITEKHGSRLMEWLQGAKALTVVAGGQSEEASSADTGDTSRHVSSEDGDVDEQRRIRAKERAKAANKAFTERARGMGYDGDIIPLAQSLCRMEKPNALALETAMHAPVVDWNTAIDSLLVDDAQKHVEALAEPEPPTDHDAQRTIGAMSR